MLQTISDHPQQTGGRTTPEWWPDWGGCAVAVVACGPSAKGAGCELLQGRIKVLAIKEAVTRLVPFADAVYGCESPWWTYVKGLPDFKGLRLAWDGAKLTYPGIHRFKLKDKQTDRIIVDEPGVIGAGGHSGFQALNIAVQFGAARILLVGFDMCESSKLHFYGRNQWAGANNPNATAWPRWVKGMENAGDTLRGLGIEVINASSVSAIKAFRKMSISEALAEWNL